MPAFVDLTGRRFGKLEVIKRNPNQVLSSGRSIVSWRCKCDCGQRTSVSAVHLSRGKIQSCGCAQFDWMKKDGGDRRKWPGWYTYAGMLRRCYNSNDDSYPWYGGKGVKVCERWLVGENGKSGFECFYEDMGPRPDGLTLDRKDPHKNYSPENCRWATWKEQANNKRSKSRTKVNRNAVNTRKPALIPVRAKRDRA